MKHPNFGEQGHGDSASFPLANLGTHFDEQRFDVSPLNVPTRWVSEDQFERAQVPSLHVRWYHF